MKTRFKNLISHIPLISNKIKLTISISLVAFAFVFFCIHPNNLDSHICLLAMLFSFLGDLSLNCVPINKRPHSLLYIGATFFMLAHLQYALAYYLMIFESGKTFFNLGASLAYIFIVLFFVSTIICAIRSKNKVNLVTIIIFCIYILIIGINFVTIHSYSWSFGAISFIGALSFLISDFIIGVETIFKIKSETLRKLVWIFYPIGQIMIIACR